MKSSQAKRISRAITTDLFTSGLGPFAVRLELKLKTDDGEKSGGGWCFEAMAARIQAHLERPIEMNPPDRIYLYQTPDGELGTDWDVVGGSPRDIEYVRAQPGSGLSQVVTHWAEPLKPPQQCAADPHPIITHALGEFSQEVLESLQAERDELVAAAKSAANLIDNALATENLIFLPEAVSKLRDILKHAK